MCRAAGMDDCFVKPTRLATLRNHLNRWRAIDSVPGISVPEPQSEPHEPPDDDRVDLGHMTQLWGSEATVKALLDAFVSSFRDDLATLRSLLVNGTIKQFREWHHRVIGAASVLQYKPLQTALEGFRRDLLDHPEARRHDDGVALIERCEVLLARIESQCSLMA